MAEQLDKKAARLEEGYFGTLEQAVEYLISCRERGESVYIDFNGVQLFSSDVTMDSAFLQVVGVTKEYDDESKRRMSEASTEEERKAIMEEWNQKRKENRGTPTRENARFEKKYLGTIDDAVKYLIDCRNRGKSVYIDFNGTELYSCDVTLDSAYHQIVGMSKEEDEQSRREFKAAKTEEEKDEVIKKWYAIRERNLNPEGSEERIAEISRRIDEESRLMSQEAKKEKLQGEVKSIESELELLKQREEELKKRLDGKKSELDSLGEEK